MWEIGEEDIKFIYAIRLVSLKDLVNIVHPSIIHQKYYS
jgi:hypothetical protein